MVARWFQIRDRKFCLNIEKKNDELVSATAPWFLIHIHKSEFQGPELELTFHFHKNEHSSHNCF